MDVRPARNSSLVNRLRSALRRIPRLVELERRNCPTSSYFPIASSDLIQDWSNQAQIGFDDDWSGVPSIVGYRGEGLTSGVGVDPRTILSPGGTVDVTANLIDPIAAAPGGVAEFHLANPTIALKGDASANAPSLQFHIDTTGVADVIRVYYQLRDLDGTTNNAISAVSLQYRVGETGDFTDVPTAFVADATTGGAATSTTAVFAALPAAVNNQGQVQIRILTSDAVGNDEWIGIDNIDIGIRGDFGDAPLSYGTATAIHANTGSATPLRLGAATLDYEAPPTGTLDGTQDDAFGDDEGGIAFTATLDGVPTFVPGTTMSVILNASAAGKLDAWLDLNRDGDFEDSGEKVIAAAAVAAGDSVVSFPMPADASIGSSFMRFRISSVGGLTATGPASDGEIEDYAVRIGSLTGGVAQIVYADGINGYAGSQDATISQQSPDANDNGGGWNIDPSASQSNGNDILALFRFDAIVGGGPLQIPVGSPVSSAVFRLYESSGSGEGGVASAHRILQNWSESTITWNNSPHGVAGIQIDGVEAASSASFSIPGGVRFGSSIYERSVTADVQLWANGAANYGWAILPYAMSGTRGKDGATSETSDILARPRLTVAFVSAANSDPTITSNEGGDTATVHFAENATTSVAVVVASDPEAPPQTLTYSIDPAGGADFARFQIVGGVLSFLTPPNHEAPTDANSDNTYEVTIAVTDGVGGRDSQLLRVVVDDVAEPPIVTSISPFVGPTFGYSVTLGGSGFLGATLVSFGASDVAIAANPSDSSIVVLAPAGLPGSYDVRVTGPEGTSSAVVHTPGVDQITYRTSLTSIVVDDGLQGSVVRSIALNFNGVVSSASSGAIALTDWSGAAIPGLTLDVAGLGTNVLTVTFSDANPNDNSGAVTYASLADGRYRISVDGSLLTSFGTDVDADANGTAGGVGVREFTRLFGDINNNAFVDATDLYPFLVNSIDKGFGDIGYQRGFDYTNNEFVDATDIYPEIVARIDTGL